MKSKLTLKDVENVETMVRAGLTYKQITDITGYGAQVICDIKKGVNPLQVLREKEREQSASVKTSDKPTQNMDLKATNSKLDVIADKLDTLIQSQKLLLDTVTELIGGISRVSGGIANLEMKCGEMQTKIVDCMNANHDLTKDAVEKRMQDIGAILYGIKDDANANHDIDLPNQQKALELLAGIKTNTKRG